MKKNYINYYKPLVQQFCKEMTSHDYDGLEHLPQPFLPIFGKGYENSAFKLLILGQDTKGWKDTKNFIQEELATPGNRINDAFESIENLNFTNWGRNTHSFFGFAMALLALTHGLKNWNVLKRGGHEEILSSFAWGNINAIELWESMRNFRKVLPPKETWEAARTASAHFNRFEHMLATLKPKVVLITAKSIDIKGFLSGLEYEDLSDCDSPIKRYWLKNHDVNIFHTYHPNYMRNVGGPLQLLNKFRNTLKVAKLAPNFPQFINEESAAEDVFELLLKSCPKPDGSYNSNIEFVAWVAKELHKHNSFMSVPCLVKMANCAGYQTRYGTPYKGGRGSYRLISSAYYRIYKRDTETAKKIANAFLKPNFSYAYSPKLASY